MPQINTIYEIGDNVWGITHNNVLIYGTLLAFDYLEFLDTRFMKQTEMIYTIETVCGEIYKIINTVYDDRDSALIRLSELVESRCRQR